jgi:hypothetical protein
MNTYRNISNELKAYFSTNAFMKVLLPIDVVFLFGGLAIILLNFLGIIFVGGFFFHLGYYAFLLGLLLAYANYHQMFLYVGFFGYGVLAFIEFFWYGIKKYGFWDFGTLLTAAVFLFLGYLVFRHSTVHTE